MFDTQLRKTEYDRLNSVMNLQNGLFYIGATATHFAILAYATYFFRYRTLNKMQTLAVGSAYYAAFGNINNILYKLIVDRKIISEARTMNQGAHVQPTGTYKARGLNF